MRKLNVKQFGTALGSTGALLYIGCMVVMALAGQGATEILFNSLLHGLDVHMILRYDIPIEDSLIGLMLTFILGWLTGACLAWIYNQGVPSSTRKAAQPN